MNSSRRSQQTSQVKYSKIRLEKKSTELRQRNVPTVLKMKYLIMDSKVNNLHSFTEELHNVDPT